MRNMFVLSVIIVMTLIGGFAVIGAQDVDLSQFIQKYRPNALVWSPNGERLVLSSVAVDAEGYFRNSKVEVFNGITGQIIATIQQDTVVVISVVWNPNNQEFFTSDAQGKIKRWTNDGQLLNEYSVSPLAILRLSWNAQSNQLAAGGYDNVLRVFDANIQLVNSLDLGTSEYPGFTTVTDWLAYSPNGLYLATSGADGYIRIRDVDNLALHTSLPIQYEKAVGGEWRSDGLALATLSNGNDAQIWNVSNPQNPQLLLTLQGHTARVIDITWSPQGDRVATASQDGTIRIWNASNGQTIEVIEFEAVREVWRVDWSSTGQIAYAGMVTVDPFYPPPTPPLLLKISPAPAPPESAG